MITAFIDTNVVIDFYQRRNPFFEHASVIFELAKENQIALVVSATTIVNSFYILRKAYDRTMLYQKMRTLCQLSVVSPIDGSTIHQALIKEWPDFEDCVQYVSASDADVDYIVTRNVDDFVSTGIPVLTPEAFLDTISE